ncbi:MAG: hypothetical protein ABSB75_08795 [Candidatus Limnocylindrales bacterium]
MAPPPKNNMLVPVILIVGLLIVVALVGVGVLIAASGSKGTAEPTGGHVVASGTAQGGTPSPNKTTIKSPTPVPGGGNKVTITPTSVSCSGASVSIHLTITLDGSYPSSKVISPEIDGSAGTSSTIGKYFTKQSDGSWRESETIASSTFCGAYSVGDHTIGIMDDTSTILAESTITLEA